MVDDVLGQLEQLARDFVAGTLGARAFAEQYQSAYPSLPVLGEDRFVVVDRLFFVCEDFYDDEELRDPGDPDENDLRAAATRMLTDLEQVR